MRGENNGTYILKNNELKRINLKTNNTISGGVYPAWYPDGSRIAFSTNKIIQFFHAVPNKRIEVFDLESDIMIYNTSDNTVSVPPALNDKNNLETFPTWSSNGKYLYYCCAQKKGINDYEKVKYNLLRRTYNYKTQEFGVADTLYAALKNNKSVSFPRCSPDGKWLIITVSDYGNFSIWHKSADLYSINLTSTFIKKLNLNSSQAESYHCWSSNGKWLIFSSRRDDGQYTRPYIAFFSDRTGNTTKPFVLPQKDPDFYNSFLKSFNLPELTTGKVLINPNDVIHSMKSVQLNASNSK
jgi:Tol biopolymer transport system component